MEKLFFIGLDGITMDVVGPLMDEGYLPRLKSVRDSGICCTLQSVVPPVSGPAWVSMATGLAPGKTGVFDFFNRKEKGYKFRPVNASSYKDRSFWDYASDAGRKVCVCYFPGLYPPYPVKGVIIGDGYGGNRGVYPQELGQELEDLIGDYENRIYYNTWRYKNNESLILSDMRGLLEIKKKVFDYMFHYQEWDMMAFVLTETDSLLHSMWKHWDERHPGHDPERSPALKEGFIKVFQQVDAFVGEVLDKVGDAGNVVIASDHGFGPSGPVFYINRWLELEGFLHRTAKSKRYALKIHVLGKAKRTLLKIQHLVPGIQSDGLLNIRNIVKGRKVPLKEQVDLEASLAVAFSFNFTSSSIFLTDRGQNTPDILDNIETGLRAEAERLGINLICQRGSDVYAGGQSALAPDLIVYFEGYAGEVSGVEFPSAVYSPQSKAFMKSGTHRAEGILMATGPGITSLEIEHASILDVAPSLLYLSRIDPSKLELDGVVLEFCNPEEKLEYVTEAIAGEGLKEDEEDEDEDDVMAKLKALGYM